MSALGPRPSCDTGTVDEKESAEVVPIDGVLDLHTFAPAEHKGLVVEYLDACAERGIFDVRVIHGKGTGALRRTVHAALPRVRQVRCIEPADPVVTERDHLAVAERACRSVERVAIDQALTLPHSGTAAGAAASSSFSDPHSSNSKWEKPMNRSVWSETTLAIASSTSRCIFLGLVWKSRG